MAANALKHGGYVEKILSDTEREIYDLMWEHTIETYKLDRGNPFHMATLHRAIMSYIKTIRLDEYEMREEWVPARMAKKDGKVQRKRDGSPVIISEPKFSKDGEYIGDSQGDLVRIRWASNAPNWDAHFQKYMTLLGTDRATEIKSKQEDKNVAKVVEGFNWLFGGKSQEGEGSANG